MISVARLIAIGDIHGQADMLRCLLRDYSVAFRECSTPSDLEMFISNGGNETLCGYRVRDMTDLPGEHIAFLERTRLWWQYQHYIFVHAGIEQDMPLELQDPYVLMWERVFLPGKNGEIHIVGHHPTDGDTYFEPGRYNLDTGAVYGQTLTACDVLTKKCGKCDNNLLLISVEKSIS